MARVTVYKVKVWTQNAGDYRVSRRMATENGATKMCGEIITGTGVEIDADRLIRGEEWTERDFVP
jgi:hypothetical protein